MKNTGSGLGTGSKSKWHQAVEAMSYRNIAGGLADEMMGFIRPSETRKCSPPFKMVIIDNCGTIVFECKVSKDGKVGRSDRRAGCDIFIFRRLPCSRTVRSSHAHSSSSTQRPPVEDERGSGLPRSCLIGLELSSPRPWGTAPTVSRRFTIATAGRLRV